MNVRTQHILKPRINEKGHAIVCLRKNNRKYSLRVHRIIADTFLGEHPEMDVRHKDNDLTNNRVNNLEWVTKQETTLSLIDKRSRKVTRGTTVLVIETGDIYESVSACANKLGCCRSDIFKQMAGILPHVKGYHFQRVFSSY